MNDRLSTDSSQARPSWTAPATTLTVLAVAAGVALARGGGAGHVEAVAFAAGVCLVGGIGGWIASRSPAVSPSARVSATLGTVVLRLVPALVALAWLQASDGKLRAAGAGELLVAFYLASLAADLIRIIMEGRRGVSGPGFRPPN